jgi:hypothetical protein
MAVTAPLLPGKTGENTDALAPALRLTLNQRHPAVGGSAGAARRPGMPATLRTGTTNSGGATAAGLQTWAEKPASRSAPLRGMAKVLAHPALDPVRGRRVCAFGTAAERIGDPDRPGLHDPGRDNRPVRGHRNSRYCGGNGKLSRTGTSLAGGVPRRVRCRGRLCDRLACERDSLEGPWRYLVADSKGCSGVVVALSLLYSLILSCIQSLALWCLA